MNVKTNVTWQGQVELFDLISQIGMSCFQKFLLFQNAFLINNINQINLGKSSKKYFFLLSRMEISEPIKKSIEILLNLLCYTYIDHSIYDIKQSVIIWSGRI